MTIIIYDITLGEFPTCEVINTYSFRHRARLFLPTSIEQYLHQRKQLLLNQNNSCSVKKIAPRVKTKALLYQILVLHLYFTCTSTLYFKQGRSAQTTNIPHKDTIIPNA